MATYEVGADKAYTTLQAAINAASDGDTIVLTGDITENSVSIDSKDLTIDLGGFTLTGHTYVKGDANVEFKNGKMTVADTDPSSGSAVITTGIYVDSNGKTQASGGPSSLTLTAVTVDGGEAIDSRNYTHGVYYKSTGGLTITDSTIIGGTATRTAECPSIGSNSSTAVAVYAHSESDGDIVITNSVITGGYGKTDAVWTGYVSQLFSPGGAAVSLHGASDVTIVDSTVTGGGSNWYNAAYAINVSNQFSGTLEVKDSTVTGGKAEGQVGNYGIGGTGIYTNMSTGCEKIDITGSTITGGDGGKSSNAIGIEYRNKDIQMNITDSTVAAGNGENASGGGAAIGIYNSDSTQVVLDNVKLNGEGNGSNTVIKGGDKGITVVGPVEVIGGTLEKTTVNIDASNLDDSTPVLSGNVSDMTYNISGKEGAEAVVEGDSIYITTDTDPAEADTSVIYVNNTWAGSADNAIVGVGKFYGINAFDALPAAAAALEAGKEIAISGSGTIVNNGITLFNHDATISGNGKMHNTDSWIRIARDGDATVTIAEGSNISITSTGGDHALNISSAEYAADGTQTRFNGKLVVDNATLFADFVVNRGIAEVKGDGVAYAETANFSANHYGIASDGDLTAQLILTDKAYFKMAGKAALNIADDGALSITDSKFEGKIDNNGAVTVSGNSQLIVDQYSGSGWIYMNDAVVGADTSIIGANVRFAGGNNIVDGATITDGRFQVGIGAYEGQDDKVDTVNGVVVNVTNDSVIDCGGYAYDGWVGSGYYGSTADKQAAMTDARYTLNIDKSQASFGYLHVSDDGILNVTGHTSDANKYKYDNSVVDFYAGDFIINGTAVFDGTDAWGKFTKVSCDNSDAANPGKLIIRNGAHYESSKHNGANNSTSLTIYKSGIVEVDNASMDIDGVSIDATGSFNINSGNIKVRGTVANTNGTFTVAGDSILNIAKYKGELITLAGGTVLTDTSVTVDAAIDSKIVANGDLTVNANAFTNFDLITIAGDLAITGADLNVDGIVLAGTVDLAGAIVSVNGYEVVEGAFNDGSNVYSVTNTANGISIAKGADIAQMTGKVTGYTQSANDDYLFTIDCEVTGGEGEKVYSAEVYNNGTLVDVVTSSTANGIKFALTDPAFDNVTVDVFVSDKYNKVQIADDYKVSIADYTAPKFNVKVATAEVSEKNAVISWEASDNFGVASYIVEVNGEKTYLDGSVTSLELNDLPNGDYAVKITAIDAAGNQKVSETDFIVNVKRPVNAQPGALNDFDGDKKSDVVIGESPVFRVLASKAAAATGEFKNAAISIIEDGWKVIGTGYFNEDNVADILVQNTTTGDIEAVFMNYADGKFSGSQESLDIEADGWTFAATGDVNGDGIDDLIFTKDHGTFTEVAAFESQYNGSFKQTGSLGGINDASDWTMIAVADMDGDNKDDVVWMNNTSQEVGYWSSVNRDAAANAKAGETVDATWKSIAAGASDWAYAGIGDFDNDGVAELLWQNKTDGLVGFWQETAAGTDDFFTSLGFAAEMGKDFSISAVGDYNGDGKDDILWTAANGEQKAWIINENDYSHTVSIIAC